MRSAPYPLTLPRSVLIVRGGFEPSGEPAWQRALSELGVETTLFDCHAQTLPGIAGRIERRILSGPGIIRLRRRLIAEVARRRPDVVLAYQGHYLDRRTVAALGQLSFVTGYHNDDPFGPGARFARYRHLRHAWRAYHGYHVFREVNVAEALAAGVPRAAAIRVGYLPWADYPRELTTAEHARFATDVLFAGHAEPDLRLACLAGAIGAGIAVRVHGDAASWRKAAAVEPALRSILPVSPLVGDDYRMAISAAKITLCFFSKRNRDGYTRRLFEIPACRGFLLSERSAEAQSLFREGVEADYFDSPDEMLDKVRFYLANPGRRDAVAAAGHARLQTSGYSIHDRMREWLETIAHWRAV